MNNRIRLGILSVALLLPPMASDAVAGTICGTIRDEATLQPVDRAGIFVRYTNGAYTGLYGASDIAGKYCIDGVPPGTYDLEVQRDDYLTTFVTGVVVEDVTTSVDVTVSMPVQLSVWPNPAHDTVNLLMTTPRESMARLELFDVRGRRVRIWEGVVANQTLLSWNFRDGGEELASGVYMARFTASRQSITQRLVRLR